MKQLEVPSQVTQTTVETSITAIKAYVNQALITRQGLVTLTGQEREFIITGLPHAIQPESVQISGIGTVTVQFLAVRLEPVGPPIPAPELDDRATQITHLEAELRTVHNRLRSLYLQQTFIQNLSEKSVDQFSQSLAQKQIDLESTRQLLQFLGDQYDEYARIITQTEQQQQALEQQLQHLQHHLPPGSSSQGSYTLVIPIEPAGSGEFVLEISYMVNQASWAPLYELTFNKIGEQVHLSCIAEVQQQTGEDWLGASLTLSTSELGLGLPIPTLHPWYLEVESSPPTVPMEAIPAEGVHRACLAGTAPKVARESGIVTVQLERDQAIASNGKPHRVPIVSGDSPCRMEYIAIPRLTNVAYLQATLTNQSQGMTLLPGKANLFRDHVFIGSTHLEKVAPGQDVQINLGIDEGLRIERRLLKHESHSQMFTQRRRSTYTYRLSITNLRPQAVSLRLLEQLPLSRHPQIRVRLQRTMPHTWLQASNLLEWVLNLPAGAQRDVSYQFSVEHPSDLNPLGLT